jgi:CelD/BcsL family acetyltransferase involved in cellulose biosynthesis
LFAVAEHSLGDAELRVVCLWDGPRLAAAAPLVRRRTTYYGVPVTELAFLGDPLSDRQYFLAATDAALEDLWRFLSANPFEADLVRLEQVPAGCATVVSGTRVLPGIAVEAGATLPYLALDGDWASFERNLTKKFRSEMRTRAKVLDSWGHWDVVHLRGGDVRKRLPALAEVEAASAKAARGYAFLSEPSHLELLGHVADAGVCGEGAPIDCALSALQVGGNIVAYLLGLLYHDRYHAYNTAYLPAFAKGSPGKYVLHQTIRFAYDSGIREFDFLRGDFFMKREWDPSLRRNCRVVHAYPGLRGSLLRFGVFGVRPVIKQRFPRLVRALARRFPRGGAGS